MWCWLLNGFGGKIKILFSRQLVALANQKFLYFRKPTRKLWINKTLSLRWRSRPGETLLSYIQNSTWLHWCWRHRDVGDTKLVTRSWWHLLDIVACGYDLVHAQAFLIALIRCWLTIGDINVDSKQQLVQLWDCHWTSC